METDEPIAYRRRIREYYLALGYDKPYQWATNPGIPFTPLKKPLSECLVAIVTTAAPYKADAGDQGPGAKYNGAAKYFSVYKKPVTDTPKLGISHIAYDRQHTTATDQNSWFPLQALQALAADGIIGGTTADFFGLPTNRSHRVSRDIDSPDLVQQVLKSAADVCVLVPNCPVCHQSVSIAACQLERAGMSTVVMGCAKDIVEYVGVPRFVFNDFPLGNAAGKPHDSLSQQATAKLAMQLLAGAPAARTTVQSPQIWSDDSSWKLDYSNHASLSADELASLKKEFDLQKQRARLARPPVEPKA